MPPARFPISLYVYFGFNNGGSLAVAPDGEVLVTGQTTFGPHNLLDRFRGDGSLATATTLEAVLGSATSVVLCGLGFDSMSRPVVADSHTLARLPN